MMKQWMDWINYGIAALIVILLLAVLCYSWLCVTDHFDTDHFVVRKPSVPKGAFTHTPEEYSAIGPPALNLAFSPLSVQLPDLRRFLVFYGKNGRPDAKEENPVLYFAFAGNKSPTALSPGQVLYIAYDKKSVPNQYIFSPGNKETPLWIESTLQGNQAIVKVAMRGDKGAIIREPAAYAEFTLPEKEYVRFSGNVWELGKWRVDGTLLARQKARWFGIDRFLERHGGEEFKEWKNKQRIDFGDGAETYSVYVGQDDCMIWDGAQWRLVRPGTASLQYPLMCIKKIDERVMSLELWDVDGKGKVVLNLIKTNEQWSPQNLEQSFKFIGARTRSQFIFEINHERMLLRPHDWLLFTESGWKKLVSAQDIDDYVNRHTVGPLFVFDKIDRKEDRQVIIGTLFNAARTEMVQVELPLQQGSNPVSSGGNKKGAEEKKQKVQETNPVPVLKTGEKTSAAIPEADADDDDDDGDE